MKSRIVCVAFDKNRDDVKQNAYINQPVLAKINQLAEQIENICKKLTTEAPDALWLLVLPEYAISISRNRGALSPFQKKYLKNKFKILASHFPQLAIVVDFQSYRISDSTQKLQKVTAYFDLHKHILISETIFSKDSQYFKIEHEKLPNLTGKIAYIRNSCFVFYRQRIWCHDKTAPVDECFQQAHLSNVLFQPAKPKNKNPLITLCHPITNEQLHIGIEICNEHFHSVLKNHDVNKLTHLHIVISDTINTAQKKYCGEAVLLVDTVVKPKLVINDPQKAPPIDLFQTNFFEKSPQLQGPLQPLYPFIKRLMVKVKDFLNTLDRSDFRYNAIDALYGSLEKISVTFFLEAPVLYSLIRDLIQNNSRYFVNKSFFDQWGHFVRGPNVAGLKNELLDLVAAEERNHPKFVDIHAKTNTPRL